MNHPLGDGHYYLRRGADWLLTPDRHSCLQQGHVQEYEARRTGLVRVLVDEKCIRPLVEVSLSSPRFASSHCA